MRMRMLVGSIRCFFRNFHTFDRDEITGYHFFCNSCGKWYTQIVRRPS